jgi:hypothetical protein
VIPSIVAASQALQAAFVVARDCGADDAANAIRLAQLRLNDALVAAVPDESREERVS